MVSFKFSLSVREGVSIIIIPRIDDRNLISIDCFIILYFEPRGLDNHWIVKPWNLARALDTQVSCKLPHILKQIYSGPKIVQK